MWSLISCNLPPIGCFAAPPSQYDNGDCLSQLHWANLSYEGLQWTHPQRTLRGKEAFKNEAAQCHEPSLPAERVAPCVNDGRSLTWAVCIDMRLCPEFKFGVEKEKRKRPCLEKRNMNCAATDQCAPNRALHFTYWVPKT